MSKKEVNFNFKFTMHFSKIVIFEFGLYSLTLFTYRMTSPNSTKYK